jgi:hypothetical protein
MIEAFFIGLGKAGARKMLLLSGSILFWQVLSVILILVVLFLIVVILYSRWRLSIKRLKRVNRLRKSQARLAKSGMSWDRLLSESQRRRAEKEAILDLLDGGVLKLRENLELLEKNGIENGRLYNKIHNETVKLIKEFANRIHPLILARIDVPLDIFDEKYTQAVERVEKPTSAEEKKKEREKEKGEEEREKEREEEKKGEEKKQEGVRE